MNKKYNLVIILFLIITFLVGANFCKAADASIVSGGTVTLDNTSSGDSVSATTDKNTVTADTVNSTIPSGNVTPISSSRADQELNFSSDAGDIAGVGGGVVFENPIASNDVVSLIKQILKALRSLVAILAIIFIVIGGIMYMISAGNSGMTERAKKIITAAIIGLVIALSAETFLVEIWNILQPADMSRPAGPTFYQIATNVLKLLLSLVWVLGIIGMVVGGMFMLTAYGNEERAKEGKKILTYAILGVVISLSALIIVSQISQLITGY